MPRVVNQSRPKRCSSYAVVGNPRHPYVWPTGFARLGSYGDTVLRLTKPSMVQGYDVTCKGGMHDKLRTDVIFTFVSLVC